MNIMGYPVFPNSFSQFCFQFFSVVAGLSIYRPNMGFLLSALPLYCLLFAFSYWCVLQAVPISYHCTFQHIDQDERFIFIRAKVLVPLKFNFIKFKTTSEMQVAPLIWSWSSWYTWYTVGMTPAGLGGLIYMLGFIGIDFGSFLDTFVF